ncbi:MAG: lipoprotein NlpI [Syntrophus sp. PtaB.Bin001]|nr:MAG: lipoprotein NlpI [Syntrophus sp. PtaB.Bin001]
MKLATNKIPYIRLAFSMFLLLPLFILTACTVDQNSSKSFSSQVRPWRGNVEAYYQLACHYQDRNRHREAVEEFKKMIAIDATDIRAYNGIGISYDALKDFPRAFLAYDKALKLDPRAGYVYNNLGYSYMLQKRYNEAVMAFKKGAEQQMDSGIKTKIENNLHMALALSEKPQIADTRPGDIDDSRSTSLLATDFAEATESDQDRHIRNLMIRRDPLAMRSLSRPNDTREEDVAIEVTNGNGVRHMAKNVGDYLKKRGYRVVRLSNADSYSYSKGNVGYRADGQETAREIATLFPGNVDLKKMNGGSKKDIRVRVLIGKDMIPYKKVFSEDQG